MKTPLKKQVRQKLLEAMRALPTDYSKRKWAAILGPAMIELNR